MTGRQRTSHDTLVVCAFAGPKMGAGGVPLPAAATDGHIITSSCVRDKQVLQAPAAAADDHQEQERPAAALLMISHAGCTAS
jgi:hypothetical protein